MRRVVAGSVGLAIAGAPGAILALSLQGVLALRHRLRSRASVLRPVLIVLLVELRSGRSVLGALRRCSRPMLS